MANPIRRYATALAFATLPIIIVACGARLPLYDGPDASNGGSDSTVAAGGAESQLPTSTGGQSADTAATGGATLGQIQTSPFPCTAATTAYYDGPPIEQPDAGCRDIYDAQQSYAPGTIRTIVAPTAPEGASCVAINCQCGGDWKWQPSSSTMCW